MFLLDNIICKDVELLNVLTIFKSLIELVTIVVPVILTIFVMIDIVKTVTSNDVDTKKLFKAVSKRVIAAVLIFLVPYIMEFAIGILPNGKFYYLDCYQNAEKEEVNKIALENANESLGKLSDIVSKSTFEKDKEDQYNAAYLAHEQARVDIKLIPKEATLSSGKYCTTKDECTKKLDKLEEKFKK